MARTSFIVCLVLLLAPNVCAQFQPRTDYPTGPSPFSVAVGDFNGDSNPDLAVTDRSDNMVAILLGNGDGTFKPHVDYATGSSPSSVVAGDFNRDGKLDLAITTFDNTVSVLLGNGDGTFKPRVDYATGLNPQWLAIGDFNGDGILDIAATNYGPDYQAGSVSVLLGNGDGTFQEQMVFPAGINSFGVMVGDFNHDGKPDLAVIDNNGYYGVWILLGNGDGSFQSPTYYPTGTNPRIGVVADFNSDGSLDLAIGDCLDNDVAILLGNGNGTFQNLVRYSTGYYVSLLAAGDFDGDGKLDLVNSDAASNSVSVLKGNGDGTFQGRVDFATGANPGWVSVGDFNHDQAPDLVVVNSVDNTVSVLLNKGPDFSMSASAASPATVSRGQNSTVTLTLKLLTLFNNPATLACSVQPAESAPTCSFSENPAIFDANGNGAVTVTLDTGAEAASAGSSGPRRGSKQMPLLWLPVAGVALVGASLGSGRGSRRRVAACIVGVAMFGGLVFQVACTGTSSVPTQVTPTTYTITITGTSGAAQHSATATLTVQ